MALILIKKIDQVIRNTALFYAARKGNTEVSKFLIEEGASINCKNNYGSTALFFAAAGGHIAVSKLLIERRASINQ